MRYFEWGGVGEGKSKGVKKGEVRWGHDVLLAVRGRRERKKGK